MDKDGGATSYSANVTVRRMLSALGPSNLWIGLKNSDDVGLNLDVHVDVLVNGAAVGSAETSNVSSGSSGFNNAQLRTLALALQNGSVEVPAGAQVSFVPSVRRTCTGGGHASGTVRLWYNGAAIDAGASRDAGTRFDATIDAASGGYFARLASALGLTAGTARTSVDVTVNSSVACPSRPFTPLGTWSVTIP